MAQMVRKQLYIRQRQQQLLKRLAKARAVSEAEVMRQALDEHLGLVASSAFVPEPGTLDKFLRFVDEYQAKSPTKPYRWRREDAYEERIQK